MRPDYETAKVLLALSNRVPVDCFSSGRQAYRLLLEMEIIEVNHHRNQASHGFIKFNRDLIVGDDRFAKGFTTGPGLLQATIDHEIRKLRV